MLHLRPMMRRIVLPLTLVAACKGGSSEKALTADVFGKVPAQPPGELGKLRPQMAIADAKKAAGALVPADEYDSFPSGYAGMRYAVGVDEAKTRIDRLRIELPKAKVALLATAWGAGTAATCTSDPCTYWFDPGTGMRAIQKDEIRGDAGVEFSAYTPLDKLLGTKPAALGFESTPIVGATVDALRTGYPGLFKEEKSKDGSTSVWLELPPTPYELYWTRIQLSPTPAGTIERAWFDVPYRDNPKAKDELIAAFDKAWGKGAAAHDITGDAKTVWFDPASGRRAELDATFDGSLKVELTGYWPLDKLLGAGPDKLGFETTPLLGMTGDEISKAYAQYIETETDAEAQAKRKDLENFMGEDKDKLAVLGEAKGGTTFRVPGTEWGDFTLIHLRFDDAGKLRQFALSIPYGAFPEAKASIQAAFEKKWGPAKAVDHYGRIQLEFATTPPVVASDSDITKDYTLEIGTGP